MSSNILLVAVIVVFVASSTNAQTNQSGLLIQRSLSCNTTGGNTTGLAAVGSAFGLVCNATTLQVGFTGPAGKINIVLIGPIAAAVFECYVDAAVPISGCGGQSETGIVRAQLISTVINTTLPAPLNNIIFNRVILGTFNRTT